MWLAEYVNDLVQERPVVLMLLRGPLCSVGRKTDCDIVLFDKTVSRYHLQIHIGSDEGSESIYVVDLNSKFKTFHGDTMETLSPNVRVEVKSGDIIRLGGGRPINY